MILSKPRPDGHLVPAGLVALALSATALSQVWAADPSMRGTVEPAAAQQASRPVAGDTARDFELESLDGSVHRLSDLKGDKRAILIFFRGTW